MDDENIGGIGAQASKEPDAGFKITTTAEGVFLTVYPRRDEGASVDEQVILQAIGQQGLDKYSHANVTEALQETSGKPVKIAELPETEPEVQIAVSKDKMEADIQIHLPKNSKPPTVEKAMQKISDMGIVFGINEEVIRQVCATPETHMVFAVGQKPVDGTNATINVLVNMENKGHPAALEDGRVDYKNLNIFTIVAQDDVLAEKIPATPGVPGTNILGQTLPAKPGKDVPLPLGKNVTAVDKLKIVAAMSGQMQLVGNKINVLPVIEIKEDVDLSTGNIEFIGSVVVRGSVQQDFHVKAEGNVEINGTVSGGTVEGKNVVIKMGIQGMHCGYIKAVENVVTKYMENAKVIAGQDILVSDVILHSQVSAGKRVVVEGKRGQIIGGTIMAGEEIRVQSVGTHMSTATNMEVGVNPMLREEYQQVRKEIKKLETTLDQAQKAVHILKSVDSQLLSPDKREMLLKTTKTQFQLAGQIDHLRTRLDEIELALEDMRYGHIKAANVIYPGVKITIGTLVKPIREPLKFVSLYAEDGEIKIGTFK